MDDVATHSQTGDVLAARLLPDPVCWLMGPRKRSRAGCPLSAHRYCWLSFSSVFQSSVLLIVYTAERRPCWYVCRTALRGRGCYGGKFNHIFEF